MTQFLPRMSLEELMEITEVENGLTVVRGSIMPTEIAKSFFAFSDIYEDFEAQAAERREVSFRKRLAARGPGPESLAGKRYIMTGIFRDFYPRSQAMDILIGKGATDAKRFTKRDHVTALFVGDLSRTPRGSVTKKLEDAKAQGVEIFGYEDLLWHVS